MLFLSLFTVTVGIVAGLIPEASFGADRFVLGVLPMKGVCLGVLLAIPVCFAGRLLSLAFRGKVLKIMALAAALAFVGFYFGNFLRDAGSGLPASQTAQAALTPMGFSMFLDYLQMQMKETVIQDGLTHEVEHDFGPGVTRLYFAVNLVLCGLTFLVCAFFFSFFFSYCARCSLYKKKSGGFKIYYSMDDSNFFGTALDLARGLIREGSYPKTTSYLLEMKRTQDRIFTPEFVKSPEMKKTACYVLTVTEWRCPKCQEATLKGSVSGQDSKGDAIPVKGMDFEMTSKPEESPSPLRDLTVA